jgi:type II secretory pathway pseudopilin PulG
MTRLRRQPRHVEPYRKNRILRQQQLQRSQQAGQDYQRALAGYRYDQPDSEAAIRIQIYDALNQGEQTAINANKGTLMVEAARLGRGADIPTIINPAPTRPTTPHLVG